MDHINLLAVLLCGLSSLLLGAIWYSPLLFGKAWQREAGLADADLAKGSLPLIYGLAFLLSALAAFAFAHMLFVSHLLSSDRPWPPIAAGAAAGLLLVAASFAVNYLFERRSRTLWLINGGYHTVQFALFGAVLAAMA